MFVHQPSQEDEGKRLQGLQGFIQLRLFVVCWVEHCQIVLHAASRNMPSGLPKSIFCITHFFSSSPFFHFKKILIHWYCMFAKSSENQMSNQNILHASKLQTLTKYTDNKLKCWLSYFLFWVESHLPVIVILVWSECKTTNQTKASHCFSYLMSLLQVCDNPRP